MTTMQRTWNVVSRTSALALALAVAGACSTPLGDDKEGDILLRVANESAVAFDRTFVQFPEDQVEFGPLPANGTSAYVRVTTAYRYAYILVEVAGQDYVLQPIDYVGESTLGPGKYTYALTPSTVPGYLNLTFRKDD